MEMGCSFPFFAFLQTELTFKAKIEKGWKLYSQAQDLDVPTGVALEFHFIEDQGCDIVVEKKEGCWDMSKDDGAGPVATSIPHVVILVAQSQVVQAL